MISDETDDPGFVLSIARAFNKTWYENLQEEVNFSRNYAAIKKHFLPEHISRCCR